MVVVSGNLGRLFRVAQQAALKVPAKAMIVSCPQPLLWLVLVLPTLQKMTKASAAVARIQCGVEATQPPKRRLPGLLCAAIVPRAAINFRSSFWRCSEEVDCGGAGAAPRGLATAVNVDTKGGGVVAVQRRAVRAGGV